MDKLVGEHLSIKKWAAEDRPREKLVNKGKEVLSDAELIAVLISSGNDKESAVGLAKRILMQVNNDLNALAKYTVNDLKKFKGIGEAKAVSIVAALELGRRRQLTKVKEKAKIASAKDIAEMFIPVLADMPTEEFWVVYMNRSNKVINKERISTGGVAGTVVDIKVLFKKALENLASSIILVHNHPSGTLSPSKMDVEITRKIKESGDLMDVVLLDHVIIAETGYYSFTEDGIL